MSEADYPNRVAREKRLGEKLKRIRKQYDWDLDTLDDTSGPGGYSAFMASIAMMVDTLPKYKHIRISFHSLHKLAKWRDVLMPDEYDERASANKHSTMLHFCPVTAVMRGQTTAVGQAPETDEEKRDRIFKEKIMKRKNERRMAQRIADVRTAAATPLDSGFQGGMRVNETLESEVQDPHHTSSSSVAEESSVSPTDSEKQNDKKKRKTKKKKNKNKKTKKKQKHQERRQE